MPPIRSFLATVVMLSSVLEWPRIRAEQVTAQVGVKDYVNVVSDKYLSFSVDPQMVLHNNAFLSNKDGMCMVQTLSPAYLRIAGPSTNNLVFDPLPSIRPLASKIGDHRRMGEKIHVAVSNWEAFAKWAQYVHLTPFFALNDADRMMIGGRWDTKVAFKILAATERATADEVVWQLGYECKNQTLDQYLADLRSLKTVIDAFPSGKRGSWRMVGSDIMKCHKPDDSEGLQKYFIDSNSIQDAVFVSGFGSLQILDSLDEEGKAKVTDELTKTRTPLWYSIKPNRDEMYMDEDEKAISWINSLGSFAGNGINVLFKELVLEDLIQPTMGYYASVIHKKLVGQRVLNVQTASTDLLGNRNVSVYAHCTSLRGKPISGAVTIFATNPNPEKSKIAMKLTGKEQGGQVLQYILHTDMNGLLVVNGKPMYQSGELHPAVKSVGPFKTLIVNLPPKSIGFWVIINSKLPACQYTSEEIESLVRDNHSYKNIQEDTVEQLQEVLLKEMKRTENTVRRTRSVKKDVRSDILNELKEITNLMQDNPTNDTAVITDILHEFTNAVLDHYKSKKVKRSAENNSENFNDDDIMNVSEEDVDKSVIALSTTNKQKPATESVKPEITSTTDLKIKESSKSSDQLTVASTAESRQLPIYTKPPSFKNTNRKIFNQYRVPPLFFRRPQRPILLPPPRIPKLRISPKILKPVPLAKVVIPNLRQNQLSSTLKSNVIPITKQYRIKTLKDARVPEIKLHGTKVISTPNLNFPKLGDGSFKRDNILNMQERLTANLKAITDRNTNLKILPSDKRISIIFQNKANQDLRSNPSNLKEIAIPKFPQLKLDESFIKKANLPKLPSLQSSTAKIELPNQRSDKLELPSLKLNEDAEALKNDLQEKITALKTKNEEDRQRILQRMEDLRSQPSELKEVVISKLPIIKVDESFIKEPKLPKLPSVKLPKVDHLKIDLPTLSSSQYITDDLEIPTLKLNEDAEALKNDLQEKITALKTKNEEERQRMLQRIEDLRSQPSELKEVVVPKLPIIKVDESFIKQPTLPKLSGVDDLKIELPTLRSSQYFTDDLEIPTLKLNEDVEALKNDLQEKIRALKTKTEEDRQRMLLRMEDMRSQPSQLREIVVPKIPQIKVEDPFTKEVEVVKLPRADNLKTKLPPIRSSQYFTDNLEIPTLKLNDDAEALKNDFQGKIMALKTKNEEDRQRLLQRMEDMRSQPSELKEVVIPKLPRLKFDEFPNIPKMPELQLPTAEDLKIELPNLRSDNLDIPTLKFNEDAEALKMDLQEKITALKTKNEEDRQRLLQRMEDLRSQPSELKEVVIPKLPRLKFDEFPNIPKMPELQLPTAEDLKIELPNLQSDNLDIPTLKLNEDAEALKNDLQVKITALKTKNAEDRQRLLQRMEDMRSQPSELKEVVIPKLPRLKFDEYPNIPKMPELQLPTADDLKIELPNLRSDNLDIPTLKLNEDAEALKMDLQGKITALKTKNEEDRQRLLQRMEDMRSQPSELKEVVIPKLPRLKFDEFPKIPKMPELQLPTADDLKKELPNLRSDNLDIPTLKLNEEAEALKNDLQVKITALKTKNAEDRQRLLQRMEDMRSQPSELKEVVIPKLPRLKFDEFPNIPKIPELQLPTAEDLKIELPNLRSDNLDITTLKLNEDEEALKMDFQEKITALKTKNEEDRQRLLQRMEDMRSQPSELKEVVIPELPRLKFDEFPNIPKMPELQLPTAEGLKIELPNLRSDNLDITTLKLNEDAEALKNDLQVKITALKTKNAEDRQRLLQRMEDMRSQPSELKEVVIPKLPRLKFDEFPKIPKMPELQLPTADDLKIELPNLRSDNLDIPTLTLNEDAEALKNDLQVKITALKTKNAEDRQRLLQRMEDMRSQPSELKEVVIPKLPRLKFDEFPNIPKIPELQLPTADDLKIELPNLRSDNLDIPTLKLNEDAEALKNDLQVKITALKTKNAEDRQRLLQRMEDMRSQPSELKEVVIPKLPRLKFDEFPKIPKMPELQLPTADDLKIELPNLRSDNLDIPTLKLNEDAEALKNDLQVKITALKTKNAEDRQRLLQRMEDMRSQPSELKEVVIPKLPRLKFDEFPNIPKIPELQLPTADDLKIELPNLRSDNLDIPTLKLNEDAEALKHNLQEKITVLKTKNEEDRQRLLQRMEDMRSQPSQLKEVVVPKLPLIKVDNSFIKEDMVSKLPELQLPRADDLKIELPPIRSKQYFTDDLEIPTLKLNEDAETLKHDLQEKITALRTKNEEDMQRFLQRMEDMRSQPSQLKEVVVPKLPLINVDNSFIKKDMDSKLPELQLPRADDLKVELPPIRNKQYFTDDMEIPTQKLNADAETLKHDLQDKITALRTKNEEDRQRLLQRMEIMRSQPSQLKEVVVPKLPLIKVDNSFIKEDMVSKLPELQLPKADDLKIELPPIRSKQYFTDDLEIPTLKLNEDEETLKHDLQEKITALRTKNEEDRQRFLQRLEDMRSQPSQLKEVVVSKLPLIKVDNSFIKKDMDSKLPELQLPRADDLKVELPPIRSKQYFTDDMEIPKLKLNEDAKTLKHDLKDKITALRTKNEEDRQILLQRMENMRSQPSQLKEVVVPKLPLIKVDNSFIKEDMVPKLPELQLPKADDLKIELPLFRSKQYFTDDLEIPTLKLNEDTETLKHDLQEKITALKTKNEEERQRFLQRMEDMRSQPSQLKEVVVPKLPLIKVDNSFMKKNMVSKLPELQLPRADDLKIELPPIRSKQYFTDDLEIPTLKLNEDAETLKHDLQEKITALKNKNEEDRQRLLQRMEEDMRSQPSELKEVVIPKWPQLKFNDLFNKQFKLPKLPELQLLTEENLKVNNANLRSDNVEIPTPNLREDGKVKKNDMPNSDVIHNITFSDDLETLKNDLQDNIAVLKAKNDLEKNRILQRVEDLKAQPSELFQKIVKIPSLSKNVTGSQIKADLQKVKSTKDNIGQEIQEIPAEELEEMDEDVSRKKLEESTVELDVDQDILRTTTKDSGTNKRPKRETRNSFEHEKRKVENYDTEECYYHPKKESFLLRVMKKRNVLNENQNDKLNEIPENDEIFVDGNNDRITTEKIVTTTDKIPIKPKFIDITKLVKTALEPLGIAAKKIDSLWKFIKERF